MDFQFFPYTFLHNASILKASRKFRGLGLSDILKLNSSDDILCLHWASLARYKHAYVISDQPL